jgi:hypothetical protein
MHRFFTREFRGDLEVADEHRGRRILMAALTRTDESEIKDIIAGKQVRDGIPKAVLRAAKEDLEVWIAS